MRGPLNWRPHKRQCYLQLDEANVLILDGEYTNKKYDAKLDFRPEDSYYGWDIDMWDHRQGERDKELTLPEEQRSKLELRSILVPAITEVIA